MEHRLRKVVSLARAQHQEGMLSATQVEEEARFHQDTAFKERQRAPKELKVVTRQGKVAAAWEAAVAEKDEVVERAR